MAREVIESVRIVVKTEAGGRVEVQGKGDVPKGILSAFSALSLDRRSWLLKQMQIKHDELIYKELAATWRGNRVNIQD